MSGSFSIQFMALSPVVPSRRVPGAMATPASGVMITGGIPGGQVFAFTRHCMAMRDRTLQIQASRQRGHGTPRTCHPPTN
jgi:hypothetical protein